jgi:transcriptional regulator with XRE-family HTH domain
MDSANVAANLRRIRRNAGLSQSQVGDKLYLDRVSISRYETGARSPNSDTLSQLGQLFQVDVAEFSSPNPIDYF